MCVQRVRQNSDYLDLVGFACSVVKETEGFFLAGMMLKIPEMSKKSNSSEGKVELRELT